MALKPKLEYDEPSVLCLSPLLWVEASWLSSDGIVLQVNAFLCSMFTSKEDKDQQVMMSKTQHQMVLSSPKGPSSWAVPPFIQWNYSLLK